MLFFKDTIGQLQKNLSKIVFRISAQVSVKAHTGNEGKINGNK